jgi:UDP-3-O-[3-hydroxymyristoyl] glucosamine N-acyltransferase
VNFKLSEITARLGGVLVGEDVVVNRVSSVANAQNGHVTFLTETKYLAALTMTKASAVILSEENQHLTELPRIVNDNPYAYFAKVSALLNPALEVTPGIAASAVIDSTVQVPASCSIGPNVVIEADVELGEGVVIGSASVVGKGASIGADSRIQSNVVIYDGCHIGRSCNVASGTVIGADGFGYANQSGAWVKIPQVGRVIIGNNVDIGANSTIDRGALDDTIIEDGVKLDNLIQVGHNCIIGEHTVIAGCVGIAGSAKIGKRCRIGGAAMILGHLEIADDVTVSPGSMITRSLHKSDTYTALMPFQTHAEWLKTAANLRHLGDLTDRIKQLEKQVATLAAAKNINS